MCNHSPNSYVVINESKQIQKLQLKTNFRVTDEEFRGAKKRNRMRLAKSKYLRKDRSELSEDGAKDVDRYEDGDVVGVGMGVVVGFGVGVGVRVGVRVGVEVGVGLRVGVEIEVGVGMGVGVGVRLRGG
uniref:Uncharacterized protein n=1 Tax=Vespula pensylvanica TaxID=30213 RepID=A0A834U9C8_VESPE|nr:hypothetical protein H0235_008920 [Vespula pensylvanica]